ncbi:MAG: T9SS type A sorting domain-containing protein [Bacteroidales bacterium]|nr:T9SS type A sorting domain-containing protein [Bacteroidales bacterium]MCF8386701.1 T9SS type A sorting domain-containing protein [Bacteroidales bacterium]MCF8397226.1 T9SS type A sorting domain-containing protein [Bacteroidales bacterium]
MGLRQNVLFVEDFMHTFIDQSKPNSMIKKHLLCWLIILASLQVVSQNWQPVKMDLKNYFADMYSIMEDSTIVNSIYVDSVDIDIQTNDSIFYLNRLTYDCDTCGNAEKITKQPHFLKTKMIKHSDHIFEFLIPGQMVLYTNKSPGFIWIYDSTNNYNAEISGVYFENVLNTYDSVKYISLQNWGTIKLSKHYGLTYYHTELPYVFYLAGTNMAGMGKQLINYKDIFDYQPGDIYQFKNVMYGYVPPYGQHSWHSLQKQLIISKSINNSSIEYFIRTLFMNWEENHIGMPGDTTYSQKYDTIIYTNQGYLDYNCVPGNACFIEDLSSSDETIYSIPMEKTDENEEKIKIYGPGLNQTGTKFYLFEEETNYLYPYSLGGSFKYTESVGCEYQVEMGEVGHERYLQAYVRNGDTTGYIIPDEDFLVSMEENKIASEIIFSVFPNPAKNYCYIQLNDASFHEGKVQILDLNGNLLKSKNITLSRFPILMSIEDLAAGIFIVRLQSQQVNKSKKLFIKR